MDTVELFSRVRAERGHKLAILMESGGERSLVADLSEDLNLEYASLSAETISRLSEVLDEGVTPENPLDAFGTGHDVVGVYRECLKAMDANPDTGVLVLAVDLARDSYLSPAYVDAVLQARDGLEKPLVGMVNLSAGANQELMATLRANGVPVLMGTRSALKAIDHWTDFAAGDRRQPEQPAVLGRPAPGRLSALRKGLAGTAGALDEHASKSLLSHYGLSVTKGVVVETAEAARTAAEQIGFPVALKTAAPEVLHKSDVGGIFLGLTEISAVNDAYQDLAQKCGPRVLVQQMAGTGVEMILGMKSDPQFGPVLLVGMGGVFVEVYRDVATALAPVSHAEAEGLIATLKGAPLLEGVRGKTPASREALVDAIIRFSTFVDDFAAELSEVDINPLLVTADDAIVLDALVIPRKPG